MNSLFSRAAVAGLLMGASVFASAADALKSRAAQGGQGLHRFPADGATVDKTFTVKFGIEGIALKPAGDQTRTPATTTCWWMSTKSRWLTCRCRPA
jgi:hypothetical protein